MLLNNPRFTSLYPVIRKGEGAYVDGRWVPSNEIESFNIRASKQPMTPEDIQILPENLRTKKSYRIYTITELRPVNTTEETDADTITIESETYTVHSVEKWTKLHPHYKCIVVRNEREA